MPLLFQSVSHGKIPFGFFNIETDMVLLNNYFFFACDMAQRMIEVAGSSSGYAERQEWEVYILEEGLIGNLMGAIIGFDLSGFIGEVYGRFPFPQEPDKFKQNPDGCTTRVVVKDIIARYTGPTRIPVHIAPDRMKIEIGEYIFSSHDFHQLLDYLWAGGFPRWKDDTRPSCFMEMKRTIENSQDALFAGLRFD